MATVKPASGGSPASAVTGDSSGSRSAARAGSSPSSPSAPPGGGLASGAQYASSTPVRGTPKPSVTPSAR